MSSFGGPHDLRKILSLRWQLPCLAGEDKTKISSGPTSSCRLPDWAELASKQKEKIAAWILTNK